MKKKVFLGVVLGALGLAAVAYAAESKFKQAKPDTYDPAKTFLVGASWDQGIGCPTNAKIATYPSTTATGTYTDPACPTGDSKDKKNEGLVLAKTGPTSNNAELFVTLEDLKGVTPTELGYDLRKPGADVNDPRGSHCGAGSPMFQLEMQNGDVYYVGRTLALITTWNGGSGASAAGRLVGAPGRPERRDAADDHGQDQKRVHRVPGGPGRERRSRPTSGSQFSTTSTSMATLVGQNSSGGGGDD